MATISRSERTLRLPTVRLRALRGTFVCLLRPQAAATRSDGVRLLAFVVSRRAPFLRRLRLYRRQYLLPPAGTPKAA